MPPSASTNISATKTIRKAGVCLSRPICRPGFAEFELGAYSGYHCRICRPVGLSANEVDQVIAYAIGHVGHAYDTRNIVDLARYLLPTPPVPTSWRRKMIALGSGDPTRAICSGLVAQSFQCIDYPVLPDVTYFPSTSETCPGCMDELMHVRHHSLFVPRDFDVSPYFQIVKPSSDRRFQLSYPQLGEGGQFKPPRNWAVLSCSHPTAYQWRSERSRVRLQVEGKTTR